MFYSPSLSERERERVETEEKCGEYKEKLRKRERKIEDKRETGREIHTEDGKERERESDRAGEVRKVPTRSLKNLCVT